MKTFLFLGGNVLAITLLVIGVMVLIAVGVSEVLAYPLYLLGLMLVGVVSHYVNSRIFGWVDEEPQRFYNYHTPKTHHLLDK